MKIINLVVKHFYRLPQKPYYLYRINTAINFRIFFLLVNIISDYFMFLARARVDTYLNAQAKIELALILRI